MFGYHFIDFVTLNVQQLYMLKLSVLHVCVVTRDTKSSKVTKHEHHPWHRSWFPPRHSLLPPCTTDLRWTGAISLQEVGRCKNYKLLLYIWFMFLCHKHKFSQLFKTRVSLYSTVLTLWNLLPPIDQLRN